MVDSFRDPVEEIRERCDLVEIISAHVALRKTGRTLTGLCPFHNEKTPSFHVNPERQAWKCFGCGEGGDVFSFVQKFDNLTFREALEQLARKVGVTLERSEQSARRHSEKELLIRANNIACDFFRQTLGKSTKAQDYLARRGLAQTTVEKYKLGYAPESWDELLNYLNRQKVSPADAVKAGLIIARENSTGFYDRFRDRLMFPILDTSERIVAFGGRALGDDPAKYLNSPETPLFLKNKTLYGLNIARRAIPTQDRVIVVEGYMDAISAQEAGFENTVATMGTALTEEHVNLIARFTKNVTLCFDADSAGMAAALRSWPVFERAGFGIRILSMPRGEDPDSMLRGGDRARFATLVERALPVPDYRVKIALGKHDLNTDEGKTAALQESASVIAEAQSSMERERLIRLLARYHPNFSTGTTLAEDHIRGEVERFRSRAPRQGPRPDARRADAPASAQKRKYTLVEQSERLLLGIIILQGIDASKVFDVIPAKEFTDGELRALAETLSSQYAEAGRIDTDRLLSEIEDPEARDLLTALLVGLDDSEMNYPVDELIRVIMDHHKNEKRRRMRTLAEKIGEGQIARGDEEYEEYYRLVRETSNAWRR